VFNDPTGHWIESAVDIAFIAYDIYDISQNGLNWVNGLSLAADVVGLILPAVTGGGLLVKAIAHADDAVDIVKAADKAASALKSAEKVDDALDTAKRAPIIIGEQMERVAEFAKRNHGLTINDFIPSGDWSLPKNEAWIKQMRDEGRTIWDIGPAFYRRLDDIAKGKNPLREAYQVERTVVKGYEKYRKIFIRIKDLGGIPGLDF